MKPPRSEWTLAEVSRLLNEPQHRLIYLCEKGVVTPDFGDARGRGSSRRFSKWNLLEFSLALRLRRLTLPVRVVGAITHTLRQFVESVRKTDPAIEIVENLRGPMGIDLRILVKDGDRLFFLMSRAGESPRLFGDIDLRKVSKSEKAVATAGRPAPVPSPARTEIFGGPERSRQARIEVSVTEIARSLELGR